MTDPEPTDRGRRTRRLAVLAALAAAVAALEADQKRLPREVARGLPVTGRIDHRPCKVHVGKSQSPKNPTASRKAVRFIPAPPFSSHCDLQDLRSEPNPQWGTPSF